MLKTLLTGMVLGVVGKKLYDEGKLDPLIEKLQAKAEEYGLANAEGEKRGKSASKASAL